MQFQDAKIKTTYKTYKRIGYFFFGSISFFLSTPKSLKSGGGGLQSCKTGSDLKPLKRLFFQPPANFPVSDRSNTDFFFFALRFELTLSHHVLYK